MHLYRHYKGGWYLTLSEAVTEEANGAQWVVYFSPWKFKFWLRPDANFFGLVDGKDPQSPREPRFRKIL